MGKPIDLGDTARIEPTESVEQERDAVDVHLNTGALVAPDNDQTAARDSDSMSE